MQLMDSSLGILTFNLTETRVHGIVQAIFKGHDTKIINANV